MQQAHVFISGFVQGVGFRYYARQKAREFGISGWVKNTRDGKVEAVFQGEKKAVEKMLAWCKEGPPLAAVKDVSTKLEDHEEKYETFAILKE